MKWDKWIFSGHCLPSRTCLFKLFGNLPDTTFFFFHLTGWCWYLFPYWLSAFGTHGSLLFWMAETGQRSIVQAREKAANNHSKSNSITSSFHFLIFLVSSILRKALILGGTNHIILCISVLWYWCISLLKSKLITRLVLSRWKLHTNYFRTSVTCCSIIIFMNGVARYVIVHGRVRIALEDEDQGWIQPPFGWFQEYKVLPQCSYTQY